MIHKLILLICTLSVMLQCETENKKEKIVPYDQLAFDWSRTFAEVVQKVGDRHFKLPEKADRCWEEAIEGFVNCLDPHSSFLGPKAYAQINQATSGSFGGIGIVIDNTRQTKDSVLTIIDVIPNGPSDRAGILPLDKIVEIENKSITGMTTEEIIAKLKGKPETEVEIKVMREKHPDLIVVNITRELIKEQSSLSFYLPDLKVCYVSLNSFSQHSTKQIELLLKKSQNHAYKGLILDLRNNSGGLLSSAIDILGLFLPKGSLVVETKSRNHEKNEEYQTRRDPIITESLPIIILINNYTASAGEILAGCLQIHSERSEATGHKLTVFLVGSRTFGKGSVQEVIPLSSNSALKLTTSLYYLPGDTSIQGTGIEPDFSVERMLPQTEQMKWFTKSHGRECAIENHITTEKSKKQKDLEKQEEEETKKKDKHKKWADRMRDSLQKDNQFKCALSIINIYDLLHSCCPEKVAHRKDALNILKASLPGDEKITLEEIRAD